MELGSKGVVCPAPGTSPLMRCTHRADLVHAQTHGHMVSEPHCQQHHRVCVCPATITIQRKTSDATSESEMGSSEKRSTAPRSKVNGFRCVYLSSRSLWSTETSQRSRSFREYRSMLRSFRQIPFPMCVWGGGAGE